MAKRVSRSAKPTVFRKKTFKLCDDRDSAATFSDLLLEGCTFDNCTLSLLPTDPSRRTVVRNVKAVDCMEFNGLIGPALFDEVEIDGLRTGDITIVWGALFRHVTLKGKIGHLKINSMANQFDFSASAQEPFDRQRREFYEGIDWALDISQGSFLDFDLAGVPAALVRRDPSSQVVITRERVGRKGWRRKLTAAGKWWLPYLDGFLGDDEPDRVLVAPRGRPKRTKLALEGLDELRRVGVVEPETGKKTKKKPATRARQRG